MGLTALDVIVLIFLAITAGLGAKRGFVTEVLSLFTWVLVVFALKFFHAPLTGVFTGWLATSWGAAVLAFAVVGGAAWMLGNLLASAIGGRTRQSVLGPLDRAMGLGFGALKGLVLASLAFMLFVLVVDTVWGGPAHRPTWLTRSRTYPLLNASSSYISDIIARRRRGAAMFGPDNASDTAGNAS